MPPAAATDVTTLPTFKTVDPPTPRTKERAPNPYDTLIHELALEAEASPRGYSSGRSADFKNAELAHVHESMIRRAARNHDPRVGISVIVTPNPDKNKTTVNLTFAVIPKRVVKSGKVESPADGVTGEPPADAA